MPSQSFGLLELGSNSVKFHIVVAAEDKRGYTVDTRKFAWNVAHEYYRTGQLSAEAVNSLVTTLRKALDECKVEKLSKCLCIATGVFREMSHIDELKQRFQDDVNVRLRVISGKDEAKLLARSFQGAGKGSLLLCDVGGASTEWGWFQDGTLKEFGSLKLGAIRNKYKFLALEADRQQYLAESRAYCDEQLALLPVPQPSRVLVTGGTARAIESCTGPERITVSKLEEARVNAWDVGAPQHLDEHRRSVFVPGIVIFERLAARAEDNALECSPSSVQTGLAQSLTHLLRTKKSQDLHSTLLLHTITDP